jgi:hypothetical protein
MKFVSIKLFSLCAISSLLLSGVASPAHAAAKGVLAGVLVGDLEGQANSVIDNARNSGDFLIWRMAEQAKAVLEAWKKANTDILNTAFEGLSEANREMFDGIDATLTRASKERELAVGDAQKITLEWAQIIKSLPFTNSEAELLSYSPRVILPVGDAPITLRMNGPRLAGSKATLQGSDKSTLTVTPSLEQELLARIDRKSLKFDNTRPTFVTYELNFIQKSGVVRDTPAQRMLTIWLPPKVLGTYTISNQINHTDIESKEFNADIGGKGKDSGYPVTISVPPDMKQQGWKIDTARIRAPRPGWIIDRGGDNGSCSGPVASTISEDGFVFNIQLGHRTGNFGKKSDAWQNCSVLVPIYREVKSVRPGGPLTGTYFLEHG